MQAYEGYIENGQFYSVGRTVQVPERRRVIITILDEPVKLSKKKKDGKTFLAEFNQLAKRTQVEDQELRAAWIKKLDAAIDASLDEEMLDIPRSRIMRAPIKLTDEV